MKASLEVLKAKPKVFVVLTRDSVCAGDDIADPHEKKIEACSSISPGAFAKAASSGYLPSVDGTGPSWTCVVNGVKIAEIRESGVRPLMQVVEFADENRVHFAYRSAQF